MAVEFFAEPGQVQGIALAPDGTRVAMLCLRHGDPHLALFAVDHPHLLTDIPLDTGRPGGLTRSPDGAALAFYAGSMERYVSDVYVLRVDSGVVRNVTAALRAHAHIPCWSPERDRLAFAAYEPPVRADHPPHVFTVALATGRIIQHTAGSVADFTPQFAPDGRTLAFRRAGDIWLLDLDRGVEHQVTHLGGARLRHGCLRRMADGSSSSTVRPIRVGSPWLILSRALCIR
jgi:Tol biopolymer transport system component